ncbi:MAG TPA: serine hydrolase domain-containing protein, partial [Pyrinomonadaceae bacterium]|nr:serine hydrolase domain-containing protein [Pyrinomonadaceae bacterium]
AYLGRIIEVISGEPYETYIDKNILRPLGMYKSYFDHTPQFLLRHRSHSYYIQNGKRREAVFDADTGITVSNSGLNSPISDMKKWLDFLLGVNDSAKVYETVLKRRSLEEMWQPQLKADEDANGYKGFFTDIGLIFFLDRRSENPIIGHGGDQNGFISYIDFQPAKKSATILVMNTNIIYPQGTEQAADVTVRLRKAARKLLE